MASGIKPKSAAESKTPVAKAINMGINAFCVSSFNHMKEPAAKIAPTLPRTLKRITNSIIITHFGLFISH